MVYRLKDVQSAGETVIPAWIMATRNRPIRHKLIFHSDRGIQYACNKFTKILKANDLIFQSMSRKGDCWDNAVAESFFNTIKVEWIYNHKFINQEQAQLSIFEWIIKKKLDLVLRKTIKCLS